jgi:hypothetical protein
VTVKLKNIRPGVLIIADAKLRLDPGQTFETESISPQMESALSSGRLARMDGKDHPLKQNESPASETQDEDLAGLTAADAIYRIGTEGDPDKLKAHLAGEKRRTVIDALKRRLTEVEGGAG